MVYGSWITGLDCKLQGSERKAKRVEHSVSESASVLVFWERLIWQLLSRNADKFCFVFVVCFFFPPKRRQKQYEREISWTFGEAVCLSSFPMRTIEISSVFFLDVYLFGLRERERASGGGLEREAENPNRLHAVNAQPDAGLELTNREIMTWVEIKSRALNRLSHPSAPEIASIL